MLSLASLVVTTPYIFLPQEAHRWPVLRCSSPGAMKDPQFQLKDLMITHTGEKPYSVMFRMW